MAPNEYLNERQTAEYLGVSERTLQRWRRVGTGPRFATLNHLIRYSRAEIDRYVSDNMHQSTAERAA